MPLSLEQFKLLVPILGEVFLRSKVEEIKCRLREIKKILEYPENNAKVKLAPMMEMIINEDDQTQSVTRNY